MELKRNNTIYSICRSLTDYFILAYHNIEYHGQENIPKKGPALLLPKHQSMKDIPLEGYLLNKYVGRPGNWIMKSSLPSIFEYTGGIRLERLKDIRKIKDRKERREELKKAQEMKKGARNYLPWLYQNNELIVMHIEGHRNPGVMGDISMPFIYYTKKVQKDLGIEIPLILMGINYENINKFRSNVIVNIKRLDWGQENLEKTIHDELARLSNIKLN